MGNQKKREWYEILMKRMENAIQNDCYFEVLFVSYMIIDDRIKTLCELYGISLTTTKHGRTNSKMLGQLLSELKNEASKYSGTYALFTNPITKADDSAMLGIHDKGFLHKAFMDYLRVPRKLFCHKMQDGTPISIYLPNDGLLESIKKWKEERNHWMHQAGDDNLTRDELDDTMIPLSLDSAILARELCDFVSSYRKLLP